jgi:hypothetical protein
LTDLLYGATNSIFQYISGSAISHYINTTTKLYLLNSQLPIISYNNNISLPMNASYISVNYKLFNMSIVCNASLTAYHTAKNIIISGYVTPHLAMIYNYNYAWYTGNTYALNITNGYYNMTVPSGSFIVFDANGYAPQIIRVLNSQKNLNITLSPINNTFNISKVYKYGNTGGYLNLSNLPLHSFISNSSIIFVRNAYNSFYIASNITYNVPSFSLSENILYAPIKIILSVQKDRTYLLSMETNIPNDTWSNTTFKTTSNYYNYTFDAWSIDPLIIYNAYPVAVITAPTAVAYDSAVLISGANSIASTNTTITNWTWKISGPQNQYYTEYGKSISQYFSITGIYTITLTVTDSDGLTNTTTTSINVVSSNQDLKIKITYSLKILSNGYYQYNVTVDAHDNVSISQFLASVDSLYANTTLTKQVGYVYYYQVTFNPNAFGYSNHTIKFEAINSIDGYNTAITYATFGSLNQFGIIAYILGHIILTIVIIVFVIIVLSFIYIEYKHKMIKRISNAKRLRRYKNSKKVRR